MTERNIAIIGGGAAGLVAAIAAAADGAAVTLLEAGERVGRKILASGNGRCNLSNTAVAPDAYNAPGFVTPALATWDTPAVLGFFADLGLRTFADDASRIYPTTNVANSVLDVLRLECAHRGVEERCGFKVASFSRAGDRFEITSADGDVVHADAVVLATGGGPSLLSSLGHSASSFAPVLGPLRTDTAPIRGLSGVRVQCAASVLRPGASGAAADAVVVATERGELLFREYGVSGIMVFDLSRALEPGDLLSIDFMPDLAPAELRTLLGDRSASLSWRTAATFFDGMLHPRVAQAVLRAADIAAETPAAELPLDRLAALLKDFRLAVLGPGDPKQAQVTRGGVSVDEFDPATMASRLVPGLFAAGEVLDVDGRCGGFNLHWAWASGIVAGQAAARFAREHAS